MQPKLNLLLVTDHGYIPDRTGGKEVSTHELAARYASDGHEVTVLASDRIRGCRPNSILGAARYARASLFRRLAELKLSYRVIRRKNVQQAMRQIIDRNRIDLTILQFDVPHQNIDFDLPASSRYVVYFRDVKEVASMSAASFPASASLVANSRYTANAIEQQTGRDVATIIPYVDKDRYVTSAGGPFVTFVNPVPVKGVELAIRIAEACPDLPFLFIEGWPLSPRARRNLFPRIKRVPNIEYRKRVSDMRSIYRQTRVLLMPSQWEESWGRVVTESHFSSIPVLASRIGGLPESVGCGGILLSPSDRVHVWADALRELCTPSQHARVSNLAGVQSDSYWQKAQFLPAALLSAAVGT